MLKGSFSTRNRVYLVPRLLALEKVSEKMNGDWKIAANSPSKVR